jgi:hypothetical protein
VEPKVDGFHIAMAVPIDGNGGFSGFFLERARGGFGEA